MSTPGHGTTEHGSVTEPEERSGDPATAGAHFRILVAYDGARFHGWQFQPDQISVQGEIERAIRGVTGRAIRIQGAGRTDAGVHALGQVASFRVETRLEPERLRMALNAHLPPDIRVHCCAPAPEAFSARFDAHWRLYRFVLARTASPFLRGRAVVPRWWPDLEPMQAAAGCLPRGEQDFHAFTTQPEGPFGCFLHEARWERWAGGYLFTIRANRFLYQMVRILVGTFLEVGRGRLRPEEVLRILERGDRRSAGPLAQAHGLYLAGVGYDPPWPECGPVEPGPIGPEGVFESR